MVQTQQALNLSIERLYELAGAEHEGYELVNASLNDARLAFSRFRVGWMVKYYNLTDVSEPFPEWLAKQDLEVGVVRVVPKVRYKHLLLAAQWLTLKHESVYGWLCRTLTQALNEELAFQQIPGRLEAYRKKHSKRILFRYDPVA